MKIFLVNPACLDKRIVEDDAKSIPIGLFYIGAAAIEKGFYVKIINLAVCQNPTVYLKDLMKKENPDIIGFSVLSSTRFSAMSAADTAKKIDPHVKIVFGGPEATFLTGHLFSVCPAIDYIVKGEGEISFLQLAEYIGSAEAYSGCRPLFPDHIRGIAYKKNGAIVETGKAEFIKNLDLLPNPGKYFDFNHISFSRGCPGNCRFCGSPAFWGKSKVRFHSTKWFVDEIQSLAERGITHFFVSDDTFTMDKKRVIDVCMEIVSRKLNITWNAISRVDFIDEEILLYMRKAGCIQISFGVESGSASIRRILGKPVKEEKIINAFHKTVSYGILPRAYFIYGSPGETKETIKQSINIIRKIKPLSAIFYILVVFPGTGLYDDLCRKGVLSDNVWNAQIEDIPWFEVDPGLNFDMVRAFGRQLRKVFFGNLHRFAADIKLVDEKELYKSHADFLSRLGMTFSHGDFAGNREIKDKDATAEVLYKRALSYSPDLRAFLGLGMLFQKQKSFVKAIDILKKGLSFFPGSKDLSLCMAISQMNTGDFGNALECLEKFENDPDVLPYIAACRKNTGGMRKV